MALIGVLFWGWGLYNVFYLYWLENTIIGVITLIRMLLQASAFGIGTLFSILFSAVFFVVHYGIFTLAHGMIITEIFYDNPMHINIQPETLLLLPFITGVKGFIWVLAGIIIVEIVHGIRQIREDRFEAKLPEDIMFSPYGRIIVLHLSILLGGFIAEIMGVSVIALVAFVIFKTIYDIGVNNFAEQKKVKEEK